MGEICENFWFLETGSVYAYYFNAQLDEQVTGLYIAGDWMVEQASFTSRGASSNKIKAYSDTTTLILSVHDLHDLIGQSQVFFPVGKNLR